MGNGEADILTRSIKAVSAALGALADLILPRHCAVCGRRLLAHEKHLCIFCLSDIPFTYTWDMPHNPMSDRFNEHICIPDSADGGKEPYCHAAALFFFNSEAEYRHIPYRIKYHGDRALGRFFGQMLGRRLAVSGTFSDVDMIIPVPLHWKRKWERGYNQAETIARGIADANGAAVRTDILKRVKRTTTQTRLSVADKKLNVRGAFKAIRDIPDNVSHILIVDDVFTTGATLHSCYTALHAVCRNKKISVATLALVSNI